MSLGAASARRAVTIQHSAVGTKGTPQHIVYDFFRHRSDLYLKIYIMLFLTYAAALATSLAVGHAQTSTSSASSSEPTSPAVYPSRKFIVPRLDLSLSILMFQPTSPEVEHGQEQLLKHKLL